LHAASLVEQARWFREFWQSCTPKVGETGATGFGQWVAERHGAPVATSIDDVLAQPAETAHGGWSGWLQELDVETDTVGEAAGPEKLGSVTEQETSEKRDIEDSSSEGSELEEGAVPGEGDEAVDEVSLQFLTVQSEVRFLLVSKRSVCRREHLE
jgi:hypothetical protein